MSNFLDYSAIVANHEINHQVQWIQIGNKPYLGAKDSRLFSQHLLLTDVSHNVTNNTISKEELTKIVLP